MNGCRTILNRKKFARLNKEVLIEKIYKVLRRHEIDIFLLRKSYKLLLINLRYMI